MPTPPQQLQDNVQLVASEEVGATGAFEQASVTFGSYQYINTASTTTVKTGAGVCIAVIVGKSTTGTITLYDNTAGSGTVIMAFAASTGTFAFQIGAKFNTGLTVVTSSSSDQVTIIYI